MLKIKNLHATVQGKEILKGIDLEINAGEIHAIMGRTDRGKVRSLPFWWDIPLLKSRKER